VLALTSLDDPAASFIDARPRDSNLRSRRALHKVRKWLRACDLHGCKPSGVPSPSRLLDVRPDGAFSTIRLVLQPPSPSDYVALSYCWGGPQLLALKSMNLEAYSQSIRVSELPLTIRDAIAVTQALGIPYLWIDSMCILQDSAKDKATEIGQMAQIYRGAYLTLSASSASAVTEGFLDCRDHDFGAIPELRYSHNAEFGFLEGIRGQQRKSINIAAHLDIVCVDGRRGSINIRRIISAPLALEPVTQRAWTYQERVLSPRTLSFGKALTWCCQRDQKIDTATGELFPLELGEALRITALKNPKPSSGRLRSAVEDGTDLVSIWHDAVRDFSMRKLSYEGDKLPAIAGLAEVVSEARGDDRYWAGLWKSSLPKDLNWSRVPGGRILDNPIRSSIWRAPTWSWASIDCETSFSGSSDMMYGDEVLIHDIIFESQLADQSAPFGALTSAKLTMSGRLGKTTRVFVARAIAPERMAALPSSRPYFESEERLQHPQDVSSDNVKIYESRVRIDDARDALELPATQDPIWDDLRPDRIIVLAQDEVWCLPIRGRVEFDAGDAWADKVSDTRMDGILLKPTSEADTFRRIGRFEIAKWDAAAHIHWSTTQRVTLI
jgi:hypothetical protein